MNDAIAYTVSLRAMTIVLNVSLVLLFLFLRTKGEKEPLTMSQKWGLSILVWLFLLNSLTILIEILDVYYFNEQDWGMLFLISRINQDLDILIGTMLLAFGLVYPRPYTNWKRLQIILLAIFSIAALMMLVQVTGHHSPDRFIYGGLTMAGWSYVFGWFVPAIIWLHQYENETSPHGRLILTLFIWAFIGASITGNIQAFFSLFLTPSSFSGYILVNMVFFIYIMARVLRYLWKTWGGWNSAEKVHVMFILLFLVAAIIQTISPNEDNVVILFFTFVVGNATWTIIRPALMAYPILRYQIFGPQLKVARPLSIILGIFASMSMIILVQILPIGIEPWTLIIIGSVLGIVLFIPFQRMARRLINRHLPLVSREERASMKEKRTTYLLSLQTAVIKGDIDILQDEVNLVEQRKILGISDREHQLLMETFAARAKGGLIKPVMDEMFLVLIDGRLLVHVARKVDPGSKAKGKDKDIVAGMLVAIRDYVQEGLRTGSRTSLETIKYGNYNLIIETEGKLVLAAVVRGPDSPDLRQDLRDQLTLIRRRHGKKLEDWDGDRDKAEGAEHILEGFMEELELL